MQYKIVINKLIKRTHTVTMHRDQMKPWYNQWNLIGFIWDFPISTLLELSHLCECLK